MAKKSKIEKKQEVLAIKERELEETQEASHIMSRDERQILAICKRRISAIKQDSDRIDYMGSLSKWDDHYVGKKVISYYHGQADLFIPMTFEIGEVISTYLFTMLFFASPFFRYKGVEANDVALAEDIWNPYLQYLTTKRFSFEESMEQATMELVKYGTCVIKDGWRSKYKMIKEYTGKRDAASKRILNRKEKAIWDHPGCEVWPLSKVYFATQDPNREEFDFVAFEKEYRYDELLAQDIKTNKKGMYKHVSWIRDKSYSDSDRKWTSGGEYKKGTPSHLRKVQIYECWLNYDLDNDGYAEDIVATIADGVLIIRCQQNPRDDDSKPLLLCQFVPRDGSPYGMGVPEILWKMQIELNDTANQVMDNASIIINNMWIVDIMALDEAAAAIYCKSRQNGIIPVDPMGAPIDNVLKPVDKPDIIQAGLIKMKLIREWGRDAIGTPSSLQGVPAKYKPSATEFAGTQSAAMRRLQKVAKRIERRIVKAWLNRAITLCYQHVDRDDLLKVVGKVVIEKYKDKTNKQLRLDCDFIPVGSLELEDKTVRVQKLLYFLKVAMSLPPTISRVNIPMLLRKIWEAMGEEFKNMSNEIFLEDPQKELTNPEDENIMLESGQEVLPHVLDNHDMHRLVHMKGEQTEEKQKHVQLHDIIEQKIAEQMQNLHGVGAGPQELPTSGKGAEATGDVLGDYKAPSNV